jgi:dihydroflavonol-4-reductase
LIEKGHDVRALVRPTSPTLALEGLPLERVHGDLFDTASLVAAVSGVDVVFHCAGQVARWRRADRMIASHIEGTRSMLLAARRNGVSRFIYTSSVAALGLPDGRHAGPDSPAMIDETHHWNTSRSVWPYGYAKHKAEMEVVHASEDGLTAVILNPSAVFGGGDVHRFHVGLVGRMLAGRLPPVAPPGGLNAIHIDDVVSGHLAALTSGTSGRRYILGGENLTHAELLNQAASALGRPGPRWRVPSLPLRILGRSAERLSHWVPVPPWLGLFGLAGLDFFYDSTRAHQELGFTPRKTVSNALTEAVSWYQSHADQL